MFNEILDMIRDDLKTASFDFTDVSIIGFDRNKAKEQIIYFYNMVKILGTIFYKILFLKNNRLIDILDGENGPISTKDMLAKSYINLYNHYEDSMNDLFRGPLYGDTLVFVTLIESEFKKNVKQLYITDKTNEIDNLVANGYILSNDDENLLEFLKRGNADHLPKYDTVLAKTTMCFDFFKRAGVLTNMEDEKKFINNKYALNPFCNSLITQRYVNQTFLDIMNTMFSTQKCNLRNDLAHCNFGYKNYYTITATSLLFGILHAIAHQFFAI